MNETDHISGIGKTSLIKTLAQRCEHIVHMDPIENSSAVHATETYASSRPHPWWRSDSDLTVTTRRRISTTGDVLDRNVCFVESPRHQHGASVRSSIISAVPYTVLTTHLGAMARPALCRVSPGISHEQAYGGFRFASSSQLRRCPSCGCSALSYPPQW